MLMLNNLDRYHLVIDAIDRVPGLGSKAAALRQEMQDARMRARQYTREHGEDIPEVAQWLWSGEDGVGFDRQNYSARDEVGADQTGGDNT